MNRMRQYSLARSQQHHNDSITKEGESKNENTKRLFRLLGLKDASMMSAGQTMGEWFFLGDRRRPDCKAGGKMTLHT